MRYIKCGECDILLSPVWNMGYVLVPDTVDINIDRVTSFVSSHISFNLHNCPECDHDMSQYDNLSFCLVNHSDNSACVHCPSCKKYIPNTGLWHHTAWEKEDIVEDDIEKNVTDIPFYNYENLDLSPFKANKEVMDLE